MDATPRQKRYITFLLMRLGEQSPIEKLSMSKGSAGKLIRDLHARFQVQDSKKLSKEERKQIVPMVENRTREDDSGERIQDFLRREKNEHN